MKCIAPFTTLNSSSEIFADSTQMLARHHNIYLPKFETVIQLFTHPLIFFRPHRKHITVWLLSSAAKKRHRQCVEKINNKILIHLYMFEASIVSFICAQYSKALPFVIALAVMMIFEQLCIIYHLSTV